MKSKPLDLFKPFKGSPQNFEKAVKRSLQEQGYFVVRGDNKNRMPDWMALDKRNKVRFIECKCYRSCETVEIALHKWKKSQPAQYAYFQKLLIYCDISICFGLKGGTVMTDWSNDRLLD